MADYHYNQVNYDLLPEHMYNLTLNSSVYPNYQNYDDYPGYYSYNHSCDQDLNGMVTDTYRLCLQILLPIICVFGIVGILLTVIVLSRKSMSTSTNSYLISLAIADLCFLIIMSAKFLETRLNKEQMYKYIVLATYSHELLQGFLTASVWLTVMLAVERYIAICHPLRAMSICTVVRARIIILLIFIISLCLRIPGILQYEVTTFYDQCLEKDVWWWEYTELGVNDMFRHIYNWTDCVLTAILPFSALLILNSCLIREIHRSTNYLRYHLASDSNAQTIITSEEIKITMMLISIIVVFFTCQAPYILLNIVKRLKPDHFFEHLNLLTYITILLLNVRSSWNFIMYCWFSEKFWNTFKRTFCMSSCFLSRAPTWLRNRIVGQQNHSEHGNSNNNPTNCHNHIPMKPIGGGVEVSPSLPETTINGVTQSTHINDNPSTTLRSEQNRKSHCNGIMV